MFSDDRIGFKKGTDKTKWEFSHEVYEKWHALLFDYAKILNETEIEKIEIEDNLVIMKLRNYPIKFLAREGDERSMLLDILNYDKYESNQMGMISKILQLFSRPVICDIGANMGFTSCIWGGEFSEAQIFAFEPIKSTYDLLNKNIQLNKLSNINTFNVGISNKIGEEIFYFYPWCTANTSLTNLQHREDCLKNKAAINCLDNIDELKSKKVDFLKIDVEGNEYFALQGATRILGEDHPVISIEILRKYSKEFGYVASDVVNFIKQYGYDMFIADKDKLVQLDNITEETKEVNFIFLHRDEHSFIKCQL